MKSSIRQSPVLAVLAVVALSACAKKPESSTRIEPSVSATFYFGTPQPQHATRSSREIGNVVVSGRPDAPVTVVEFSDFQCPYCAQSDQAIGALRQDLVRRGKLRWVWIDFPLVAIHDFAEPAALLSRCVLRTAGGDAYNAFSDALFREQAVWSREGAAALQKIAARYGLSQTNSAKCLAEKRDSSSFAAFATLANEAGVSGTPTHFVNGLPYPGALDAKTLEQLVNLVSVRPVDEILRQSGYTIEAH